MFLLMLPALINSAHGCMHVGWLVCVFIQVADARGYKVNDREVMHAGLLMWVYIYDIVSPDMLKHGFTGVENCNHHPVTIKLF